MPNPYQPQGALPSFLNWLDEPGAAIRNLLAGKNESAGRKALDFALGPAHLLTPDNVLPHFSRPEDEMSGGDLVGIHEPGIKKALADIGLGVATDPLSLLSFGTGTGVSVLGKTVIGAGKTLDPLTLSLSAAKGVANKGIGLADQVLGKSATSTVRTTPIHDIVDKIGAGFRSATGWQDVDPVAQQLMQKSAGTGNIAAQGGTKEVQRIFANVPQNEQVALGEFAHGVHVDAAGKAHVLPADETARMAEIVRLHPGADPARMTQALNDMQALSRTQADDAVRSGAILGHAMDLEKADKYIPRQFHFPQEFTAAGPRGKGAANFTEERTLETPDDIANFINKNPDAQFERNAMKLMMDRAAGQGRLLQRAELGQGIIKQYPNQVNWGASKNSVELADSALAEIAKISPDTASRLNTALNGMDARGNVAQILATANRFLKPVMVSGMVIPKVGSIIRNRMGMPLQAIAEEGSTLKDVAKLANPVAAANDIVRATDHAYSKVWGTKFLSEDKLGQSISDVEKALQDGRGNVEETRRLLRAKSPYLEEALNNGVLDGYVSSEQLLKKAGAKGIKKAAMDLIDAPSEIFQMVEQRGRLSYFLNLRHRGIAATDAAKQVKDAFYDYSVSSQGNRTLRDIIPFAQFMLKAIPQQAKFISRNPAVGIGLNPLFSQDVDHPVSPYMLDSSRVALGQNDNGTQSYLTGFGLPVEALNSIPMSGSDVSRKIVGATHPFIKTAVSAVTGQDPYFQTPWGSYNKAPVTGDKNEFGRYYNMLAGTGLIEPIAGPLRMLGTAIDDKHGVGARAVDLLSGAHITDVDEDLADRQILDNALRANPNVQRYTSYYQQGEHDQDVDALMKGLADAKARAKAKRLAASTL